MYRGNVGSQNLANNSCAENISTKYRHIVLLYVLCSVRDNNTSPFLPWMS
jgi:hypothetical protein